MRVNSFLHRSSPQLFHGDPNGLALRPFPHPLHEGCKCAAAVNDFADYVVLAYEDAAAGILRGVAGMDADTLAVGYVQEQWQPLLELGAPRDGYGVASCGYGLVLPVACGVCGWLQRVTHIGIAQLVPDV